MKIKTILTHILWFFCAVSILYGLSRLYYLSGDGFAVMHITSDLSPEDRWTTRPLTDPENSTVERLLNGKFFYLGKGCQSYVFESEDGKYVMKFFKYQRLKEKIWPGFLSRFSFIDHYLQKRNAHKKQKREGVFLAWKLAFDFLSKETGTVYVHLNKSDNLKKNVTIIDKLGIQHSLWIDQYEFMIQKKAVMLCDEIAKNMSCGEIKTAEILLQKLVQRILSEYKSGFADNDHALIQNTGVWEGEPIHIDVGQFVREESVKEESFYLQELYTKTYKFRIWLRQEYPELCDRFEEYLSDTMGDCFKTMKPLWRDRIEIFQE